MDEPSKYTVAVYELINQQGDKTAEHISDLTADYLLTGKLSNQFQKTSVHIHCTALVNKQPLV